MSHLQGQLKLARFRYRVAVRAMHQNRDPAKHEQYAQRMYDARKEISRIEAIERAEKKKVRA